MKFIKAKCEEPKAVMPWLRYSPSALHLNDGDISLVIADQRFVDLAERNVKRDDIVPLYYIMKKAPAQIVNQEIKNEGICKAFSTCKIGIYSNNVSKVWNQVDWKNISEEERQRNLNLIKYLCLESNFSIDSAKTNYMCVRPEEIDKQIKEAIHYKVPHYFIYAKGRTEKQVEPNTPSLVNRLEAKIINPRLSYKATDLGVFNYKYLMNKPNIKLDERVINKYTDIGWKFHWRLNMRKDEAAPTNLNAVILNIRKEFQEVDPNLTLMDISDMLVEYLYGVKKYTPKKEMLWQVFGEFMVSNLRANLPQKG